MLKCGENSYKREDSHGPAVGSLYAAGCREGQTAAPLPGEEPTFGQVLALWVETNRIRCKAATTYKYQYLIETHILPQLGGIKICDMSNAAMINAFLMDKMTGGKLDGSGGLSSSTVRSIMLIINSALKFAASEEMCRPLRTPIFRPAGPKAEVSVLALEDQRRLEAQICAGPEPTGLGVLLSLQAGLRIGEVCALAWQDVDLSRRILHIRHTVSRVRCGEEGAGYRSKWILEAPKTRSSAREIPICSPLFSVLSQMQSQSEARQGFVASGGASFVSPRTYEYRYRKLLQECGIRPVNYHVLRHTFATRCVEAGVDVKSLSEMLGHASIATTLHTYVHSSFEWKRTQLEKMAAFTG